MTTNVASGRIRPDGRGRATLAAAVCCRTHVRVQQILVARQMPRVSRDNMSSVVLSGNHTIAGYVFTRSLVKCS